MAPELQHCHVDMFAFVEEHIAGLVQWSLSIIVMVYLLMYENDQ